MFFYQKIYLQYEEKIYLNAKYYQVNEMKKVFEIKLIISFNNNNYYYLYTI